MVLIDLDEQGYCTGFSQATELLAGYVKLPENLKPSIGQRFDMDKMQWVENDFAEWKDESLFPSMFSEPNQPTNAEIAQMISDLQADLIIAGVL